MGLDIFFYKVKKNQIGYFRKVNFLVKFFEDECGMEVEGQLPVRVSKENAEELLKRCNEVLEDHSLAEELLPTMEGPLFGSTDYDEYYFRDIGKVRDFIQDSLLLEFDSLDDREYIDFDIWY